MRMSKEEFQAVANMPTEELLDRANQLQKIFKNECESENPVVALLAVMFQLTELIAVNCTYEQGLQYLDHMRQQWEKYHPSKREHHAETTNDR
jgi:hypothetical protein